MAVHPLKRKWQKAVALQTRSELCRRFPNAFYPKGFSKRALKIGISDDIRAACPDIKPWALIFAMRDYCSGPSYIAALAAGGGRVDLSGTEVEPVSAEHANYAIQRFSEFTEELRLRWTQDRAVRVA